MEHLLNDQVKNIQISGIRKIANKVAALPGTLSLTIGQPDFPTPTHIMEAAHRAIDEGRTTYTPNPGLPELREAAAAFVARKYGLNYRGLDEVIVTNGASEALDITLRTILSPGDEVVLPVPIYPGYEPLIRLSGGIPVLADTRNSGFKLTAEVLEPYLTERTKAVILGYPSNPTGRVMSHQELEAVADLLKERDLFIISDEIYSELIYDTPHVSIATLPGMRDRTIVINGLSKSHSMTGWRIGFTLAPAEITQHMVKVHQYNVTCASSISQYAALEALTVGVDDALPMREEYRKRRDYVHGRLTDMGIPLEKPEGAFYLFPSIAHFGLSSMDFTLKLLEEQGVAVVPGDAFSSYGEGYIRLSYAYGQDVLEQGLDKIEKFVRGIVRS
ncbi:aromatic amino acid aminotransferase [Paenibacillus jamilae]|uniref:Aromatic amino acid aminotransferase n=1 Tax=Paenibacillus jamilae TaxID=114136 RepID=A0ACC4ZRT5_9BACL|nr:MULTISPECIES: aminotransferase A [Paenibacillus]AJE53090.1 aromatic amino acid aminotransferase [Paenibacillus polymyxa]AUO07911.1 aromatic amino acid aminotransferase [Paenibacillus sp. lzh-N1]KTS80981.1 aromatic amino acid aminotransferase [Paenibacillus jamilae]QOH63066.1 aminotransferase A [Paenibacillus polymyxa]